MARVLIVDDEPHMRELVVHMLGATRHEVVGEAADGDAALALWREHDPDLIILDHMLPAMSGLEVARIMLAEKPHQPIILFTAFPDRVLFGDAEQVGVAACVAKTDLESLPGVIAIAAAEPTL